MMVTTLNGSLRARAAPAVAVLALLLAWSSNTGESSANTNRNGVEHDVTFSLNSPLSTSAEIIRRMTSPLTALRAFTEVEKAGLTFAGQPIKLAQERFLLFVPAGAPPPAGYSLLVFVPPWPKAQLPPEWIPVLDQHHMILVSADNSGNEANPFDRRVPLALSALVNIRDRFPIDEEQIFVGGFSGGSRIALRLLLGYPDQFRGALLNAGSDPIGDRDLSLPAADLFARVQESTRLVYVTGERDEANLVNDMHSRSSLKRWCVLDVVTLNEPRRGHDPADAPSFKQALDALTRPAHGPDPKLESCRATVQKELDKALDQVTALFARHADGAKRVLQSLDAEYGGLAAPRSLDLARQ
jgi:pimeloyl-ACP methyl ester carboxylesterase